MVPALADGATPRLREPGVLRVWAGPVLYNFSDFAAGPLVRQAVRISRAEPGRRAGAGVFEYRRLLVVETDLRRDGGHGGRRGLSGFSVSPHGRPVYARGVRGDL